MFAAGIDEPKTQALVEEINNVLDNLSTDYAAFRQIRNAYPLAVRVVKPTRNWHVSISSDLYGAYERTFNAMMNVVIGEHGIRFNIHNETEWNGNICISAGLNKEITFKILLLIRQVIDRKLSL